MSIKDRWTIYVKRHNKVSLKETVIVILSLVLILAGFRINEIYGTNTYYEYIPYYDDAVFRATFVGDVMMGRSVEQIGKQDGYDRLFENVSYLWNDSDYVICNLESAVLNTVEKYNQADKEITLYAKSKSIVALKNAGFNLVSAANDHVRDYGSKGLRNTINVLNNHNLEYVGIGENIEEAKKYNIKKINGLTVATSSISEITPVGFSATEDRAGIFSSKSYDDYPEVIREAKKEADIVIAYIHWGEEYSKIVTDEQRQLARNLVNAGADIVIGSHPHTLQPIEKYNDGIIFYSLGNFIFDQGWTFTNESTLINFSLKENGNYVFECMPVLVDDAIPQVTNSFYHKMRIFNTLSQSLDTDDYMIKDSKLIIEGNFERQ